MSLLRIFWVGLCLEEAGEYVCWEHVEQKGQTLKSALWGSLPGPVEKDGVFFSQ